MTPTGGQGDADDIRCQVLDTLTAVGIWLASADPGSPRLAARLDEAGFLVVLAASLLTDPTGDIHQCVICERPDIPLRPFGTNAGGGMQWACLSCRRNVMGRV